MRAWALALLVLGPTSAWAAALPDFELCALTWSTARYNVYQQTSPTGPAILMGTVAMSTALGPSSFPCPTAQGTYYYSLGTVDLNGIETRGPSIGFTIKGGAPPLVFAVGVAVKVNTALVNVRSSPAGPIVGTQRGGTPAQIVGGPVIVTTGPVTLQGTWWQLDYAAGVDGWGLQTVLVVVPTP